MVDLNAPPDDDDDEIEELVQAQIETQEEAEGEIEVEEADAEHEDAEDEERVETAVEIMRREREERKAKLKLLRQHNPVEKPAKIARSSTSTHVPPRKYERPRPAASLPEGWVDCPSWGEPIGRIVPSKVPLGEYFNEVIDSTKRYSWQAALRQQRHAKREVGMVIDLTNTTRYYSAPDLERMSKGIKYVKIPCRGRNEVPDNESVNRFIYHVTRFLSKEKPYIVVHCTHGFNRTGFMIVHYLMRTQRGCTVEQALQVFAKSRSPGIYKQDYVETLYTFYNERRPEPLMCPSTPEWKHSLDLNGDANANDDDDDGIDGGILAALEEVSKEEEEEECKMTNDDVIGDRVHEDHQLEMQMFCVQKLGVKGGISFPGSQPVSLDKKHLQLLRQRYYYATWKADGTRYMMLIANDGVYLIDRKFNFRRVQLRFPMKKDAPLDNHHLLDGEMVIDKDPETGVQNRRYLVYDIMVLNNTSLVFKPFRERWKLIEKEIIEPRKQDAANDRRYRYDLESFRVRRKDFWLLSTTEKLLHDFIPKKLSHEADGLIFQGWDDQYIPRTHNGLLKWKYAHMNSVDFLVKFVADRGGYCLYLAEKGKPRIHEKARVKFPDDMDPATVEGKIIECAWLGDTQEWEYMRIRPDKDLPNAWGTYEKVMGSIKDNITEDVLFEEIREIINLPMYKERIAIETQARRR